MGNNNENPKWILIVDDEPDIREALVDLIDQSFEDNVRVIQAENGIDATRKINYQAFDCIITDLKMPKKDGHALIKTIRQNSFNESTPIIVLSGHLESEIQLSEEKFVYFFAKPFSVESIFEVIDRQIKLGSNENRISSISLNDLIQQTSEFIQSVTNNDQTEKLDIKLKKAGDALPATQYSTLEMTSGKVSNVFSLMVGECESENATPSEDVIPHLCRKILQKSQSQALQSLQDATTVRALNYSPHQTQEKAGIIVTVGNPDLRISIFVANNRSFKFAS